MPPKPPPPIAGLPDDPLARDAEIQARLAAAHLQIAAIATQLAGAQAGGDGAAIRLLTRDWHRLADLIAQLGSVAGGADVDPALARVTALNGRAAADDPAQLDGSLPVALLPVRVETRFAAGAAGPELLVRIYPDDIHADRHERELTAEENAAGHGYWLDVLGAAPNSQGTVDAWRRLAQQYGPRRAAWIASVLTPTIIRHRPPGPAHPALPGGGDPARPVDARGGQRDRT